MGFQARVVHRLPYWVRVAPLDTMFSVMGLFSASATMVGVGEPSSLVNVLPWWGPILWSFCLFCGCGAWLAGVSSIKENDGMSILVRMPALIFGLYLVSLASFAYALALVLFAGLNGVVASVFFFAIAAGTYLRRIDLSSKFRGDLP